MDDYTKNLRARLGENLRNARTRCGLKQTELAARTGLHQTAISQMEAGKRVPTIEELLRFAEVLRISIQWFLTGSNYASAELADLAFQLQELGITDLHVENARVPGAFRHDEEAIALALAGKAPSPRIVEAMPAVLAWNARNHFHLRLWADYFDPRIKYRLGWLADIATTIHQNQGFPGGCPYFTNLESLIAEIRKEGELPYPLDSLGFDNELDQRPPITLRWKMGYPAPLSTFRERAERLYALRMKQHPGILGTLKT